MTLDVSPNSAAQRSSLSLVKFFAARNGTLAKVRPQSLFPCITPNYQESFTTKPHRIIAGWVHNVVFPNQILFSDSLCFPCPTANFPYADLIDLCCFTCKTDFESHTEF